MASIFGIGDHSHDTQQERAHLTNSLIVLFGLALLAFFAVGFATQQLQIEGTLKADNLWMLFVTVTAGLFGWVMRGKGQSGDSGSSGVTTPGTPTTPAAPTAPQYIVIPQRPAQGGETSTSTKAGG